MNSAPNALSHAFWVERFLALSYTTFLNAASTKNQDEKIAYLCYGNWLAGILGGMSKDEPGHAMCTPCIIKNYASENAKNGAEKRHAQMRELETWTVAQYRSGKWPSANKAAHDLKDKVINYGRSIGAILTEENAQRTIAEWIRKAIKESV